MIIFDPIGQKCWEQTSPWLTPCYWRTLQCQSYNTFKFAGDKVGEVGTHTNYVISL